MKLNKRVLVYMEERNLKPTGGPAGYLYNLKLGLNDNKVEGVEFIKTIESKSSFVNYYNKLPITLKNIYRVVKRRRYFNRLFDRKKSFSKIDLNKYDIIHFHSTRDMFEARGSLDDYNGKIILTSHTPKPPHLEIIQDAFTDFERWAYSKYLTRFSQIDEYAFNKADHIIFPCEGAEEPYFNNWVKYAEIKKENEKKYRYLLTGTRSCTPKMNRAAVLKKYNIPEDSFVVSFVGRHNETKGYDVLKDIGEKLLKVHKDVYFLIGGVESPIVGLKNERWIEVGWTNDPHSLIAASDVFVLPNRETYFDLVMLEVLSLGKIVVASNTGGNRFFKEINAEGIFLYEHIEDAIEQIMNIKGFENERKKQLENSNIKMFDTFFSNDVFCEKYIDLINGL